MRNSSWFHRVSPFTASLFAVAATLSGAAWAQSDWPVKPVRVIVAFAAGGSSDVVARQLSQHLSGVFGQQFIVENRTGAGGNIGADVVAKAAPDGHVIGVLTSGPLANNKLLYKSLPFDPQKDLTPVALIGEIPLIITANAGVKAANLKEFAALAKAGAGKFSAGHPGNGTIGHLALESFKLLTGASIQGIPYKGDTPVMTDVIGGQLQMGLAPITAFIPNIQAGKLTGLAVTSKRRFSTLPNLPTAIEQGINLEAAVWSGVVGPAGLPRAVVTRLNQEVNKFIRTADVRARLAQLGLDESTGSPELLANLMNTEVTKWRAVVDTAKISLE